ncbi:hypothetical protein Tdes44962_MAKER04753 [Teratosphaeria destructans]|uniref:Uncharacterized protein n=1 Tax=Teratosphaeria destructans TaxID=418781 RepID=A0A9W7SLC2_9PEZI|nr:hypothetical protein Tdes44962_MAKER04753 [Teratosphaeria destructans]
MKTATLVLCAFTGMTIAAPALHSADKRAYNGPAEHAAPVRGRDAVDSHGARGEYLEKRIINTYAENPEVEEDDDPQSGPKVKRIINTYAEDPEGEDDHHAWMGPKEKRIINTYAEHPEAEGADDNNPEDQ